MLDAEVAQAPCSAQEYKDKQIQCNTFVIYMRKALELWRNFMRIFRKGCNCTPMYANNFPNYNTFIKACLLIAGLFFHVCFMLP